MKNIVAVVVLYNPAKYIIENISSYINSVDKIYAIDNSDEKNMALVNKLKENSKFIYINNYGNQGIAHALNVGCCKAIDDGYDWILTMDQDSTAEPNMLDNMFDYFEYTTNINEISIISPLHSNPYHVEYISNELYSEVLATMTSGNLLNLTNYKKIGPFMEDLFIDHVDHEYCLRSHEKGYKVIQANNAVLRHNLGDLKQHTLFGKKFFSTNHSAIRSYYSFRNRIRLIQLYHKDFPKYCFDSFIRFFIDPIIVLLFESEKLQKIKMMGLGIRDGLRNKYGKFNG